MAGRDHPGAGDIVAGYAPRALLDQASLAPAIRSKLKGERLCLLLKI